MGKREKSCRRCTSRHVEVRRNKETKKRKIAKFPLTKCCFPLSGFYYIVRHFVKFLKWHFTKNIFDRKFLSSFGFWLTDFESSSCSPQSLRNRTSQEKKCYSYTIEPRFGSQSAFLCGHIVSCSSLFLVVHYPVLFNQAWRCRSG